MTLRLKILSIAYVLLIVFGIAIGISAVLQHRITDEVGDVTRYHEPLATLIADLDVKTFEYELIPLRILRRSETSSGELETLRARAEVLATHMTEDFRKADLLLASAVANERVSVHNRVVFARLQSSVDYLQSKILPFITVGRQVMTAIASGRIDEARTLSRDFRSYEEAFGPDIAAVRYNILDVTGTTTKAIYGQLHTIALTSFGLFAITAAAGLGVGVVVSGGVVRTLRHLLESTKAVEEGQLVAVNVPIQTNDEVGQLASAFNRMVDQLRVNERIKDTFGKYVDPRIVAALIEAKPEEDDHAERRVVTVFFSDIQGFTSISEQLTATAMVNLLNHYFAAATRCIRASSGIVDKYIGDAIMAFWSSPFSSGDSHAEAACLAALAQQQAIEDLNKDMSNIVGLRRNAPELVVRMGIATGEVVVGTIGSPVSKSFTVIGDTVNLASRLEGVNKVYGTRLIIADDTLRLAQQAVETRELDLIAVAGKTEAVRIHELICPIGHMSPADAELGEEFAKALAAYRARQWDDAEGLFRHCLVLRPSDGPSSVFIERIETLRREPPPADWDGVWRFTHK